MSAPGNPLDNPGGAGAQMESGRSDGTCGLAIMVKTPGHSPVKTRLAQECGQAFAEGWHLRAAAAVAAVAARAACGGRVIPYWAVAEPAATGDWPGLPVLAQGEGALGERMARVHGQLLGRHGQGLLVGADAPQLTVAMLDAAVDWLVSPEPRLVLGPACDGGFWLVGANRAVPLSAWTGVRYSTAATARDFMAALDGLGRWRMLETLTDVDRGADLAEANAQLRALPEPLPAQQALVAWMSTPEALPS